MTKGGTMAWRAALAIAAGACAVPASAAPDPAKAMANDRAEAMAVELVGKLKLDEKFDQLLNVAPAIPRLNIPDYNWWTESLHGALGPVETTNFPEPIALAATFNTPLVHDVATAISAEVRALHTLARQTGRVGRIGTGLDTWSPNINIFRDPRWGRGQETYGEDPYLTARMGVAFVTGMQGEDPARPDVIATPKHFAVHSGPESTRHEANVYVSPHDLEDTYLPAFRAAIVEGKAGSIMCAYNRINGQPACSSDLLLKDHLRGAWGFTGYVVSDCDAVRDIADNHKYAPDAATAVAAALRAGVDNECNTRTLGDTAGLGERYREALRRNLVSESDIDRALVRLFAARYRNGDLPGLPGRAPERTPTSEIGKPAHGALALKAAEQSTVLLKNDGILPLKTDAKVAVIGPLGDATRVLRGNYSSPLSAAPISVVEGLRRTMPVGAVTLAPYGESITDGDRVPGTALRTPNGKPGILVRYYNPIGAVPAKFDESRRAEQMAAIRYAAKPIVSRVEPDVGDRNLELAQVNQLHRRTWSGFLVPSEGGAYRVGLTGPGAKLTFDGRLLADRSNARYNDLATLKTVTLVKGRRYPVLIEATGGNPDLVWKRISTEPDEALKQAAANADVLVAVVGLTSDLEAEETGVDIPGFKGGDKTTLDLPADQLAFLEKAKATGKPLIVVAMNGSPINLAWARTNAAAILEAWYPGQSGGLALANILTGKVSPSGRLPLTFYESVDQIPPFDSYDMKGRTYRYFEGAPVYPFGYGLSYSSFTYGPLTLKPADGGAQNGLDVATSVTNSGGRDADEVAQLYVKFPAVPGAPRIALRGFQRISLKAGESRAVSFALSPRDLSMVNIEGDRLVAPGNYEVSVGSGQPGTGVATISASFSTTSVVAVPR